MHGAVEYDVPLVKVGFFAEADVDSWEGRVCSFVELLYSMLISGGEQAVDYNWQLSTFVILFPPPLAMMTTVQRVI